MGLLKKHSSSQLSIEFNQHDNGMMQDVIDSVQRVWHDFYSENAAPGKVKIKRFGNSKDFP